MIEIVLTADYEVFGDGSGDVRTCVVEPTAEMLSIADDCGARLTLFVDMAEYRAFADEEATGADLDHAPATLMREQVVDAVRRGHDAQLHLHPQWLDARLVDGRWEVNLDLWRLPSLPLGDVTDERSIRGLLHRGKATLEAMLQPEDPDYECLAFRAGGYCIQPAADVLRAMREVGLRADSSVWPGGVLEKPGVEFDFRGAEGRDRPYRPRDDDITRARDDTAPDAVWEVPVHSRSVRRLTRLRPGRVLRVLRDRFRSGPKAAGMSAPPGPRRGLLARWLRRVPTQWDMCTLTSSEMYGFLETFRRRHGDETVPLVMMGHPKLFGNGPAFRRFLRRVVRSRAYRDGEVRFATMREVVRRLTGATTG